MKYYVIMDANDETIGDPTSERKAYEALDAFRSHAKEGGHALPLRVVEAPPVKDEHDCPGEHCCVCALAWHLETRGVQKGRVA